MRVLIFIQETEKLMNRIEMKIFLWIFYSSGIRNDTIPILLTGMICLIQETSC